MSDIPSWDISYFVLAKNLFTKYCCPLPLTPPTAYAVGFHST